MNLFTQIPSPVGEITVLSRDGAISSLYLDTQQHNSFEACRLDDAPIFLALQDWLAQYFSGTCPDPTAIPLSPAGTAFQIAVWHILMKIPYGETTTYGCIAQKAAAVLGKPRMSAQAIGQAVGHNPISILIPCHRVIGADGRLTGYAGGLEKKVQLLRLEGHFIRDWKLCRDASGCRD